MPRKKQVDSEKLIEAIESGQPSAEIMKQFGINTSTQLKSLYMDALMEVERVPVIISGKKGPKPRDKKANELRINKRGSLVVTREMIEEMGFSIGDQFSLTKSEKGLSLKKI